MARAFRFDPPRGRADLVTRPRLLRALLSRWERRVVTVTGGPGLGKTTLLVQAIAENALAPRGEDVWVGLDPADAERDSLARALATALDARGSDAGSVAAAIWRRSPTEVCVLLDDVHVVAEGSSGAAWLEELVEALPVNGHLLLASRVEPTLRLARLWTQRQVAALDEEALRFSDEELGWFAVRRGVGPERLEQSGGWPAMAELAASVERPADPHTFVWEEVLEPLGADRRRLLALVCDLGGADDALASAALGAAVDLGTELAGVPLVAAGPEGWRVPHPLWRSVPGLASATEERGETRRRAVRHLVGRGLVDEAFALLSEAELWEQASDVLRSACVASDRPTAEQLDRWLAAAPPSVRDSVGGRLAVAFLTTFRTPADAVAPLTAAAGACREAGDPTGELAALTELGRVAWWSQDMAALAPVGARIRELADEGHPLAQGLAAFGRAVAADVMGDDHAVLAALDQVPEGVLDPGWEASTRWLRAQVLLARGRPADALAVIEAADPGADPALRGVFGAVRLGALWATGHVDEVAAELTGSLDEDWSAGVAHNRRMGLLAASGIFAAVGDLASARRCVELLGDDSLSTASTTSVAGSLAAVALHLAEGDEAQATDLIRSEVERSGMDRGLDRRQWRAGLVTSYVLLPEVRTRWDAADLGDYHRLAHTLARGVVAARTDPIDEGVLGALAVPEVPLVRSALHFRFAADLAVGLTAVGRPEGQALLEAIGPAGRAAVRQLAAGATPRAKPARTLLAGLPALPVEPTFVGVLGTLVVRRGKPGQDETVPPSDPDLRRERVRALLAFLVSQRATTRAACMAALWPDLDERSAANNLRVTLTYLLRVLEPDRPGGEPSFHVRLDGQRVQLVASSYLLVDVDLFDGHVAAAAQAEDQGSPSVALDHHLAGVELYRGELHADIADAEWLDLDREHYRSRFVAAAVRAGELLVGRGDTDPAEAVARRALAVDPWSEEAYAVLVAAALSRGDRSAAQRQLDHCSAALAELGLELSDATRRLLRRARS